MKQQPNHNPNTWSILFPCAFLSLFWVRLSFLKFFSVVFGPKTIRIYLFFLLFVFFFLLFVFFFLLVYLRRCKESISFFFFFPIEFSLLLSFCCICFLSFFFSIPRNKEIRYIPFFLDAMWTKPYERSVDSLQHASKSCVTSLRHSSSTGIK